MALPPPCRPTSTSSALIGEFVEEILIRILPDDPADLVRAALVCKPWRRILSDPGFLRRYRAFHRRRAPLLGFFCNDWAQAGFPALFKPAAAAFPSLLPAHNHIRDWFVVDCRHGRVLLRDRPDRLGENLMVWDPISDAWQELQVHDDVMDCEPYCFAVLCAVAGCDHHDCRGGPFLVVFLGAEAAKATDGTPIFRALIYSSETRAWGTPSQLIDDDGWWDLGMHHGRAAVIGDEIYCIVAPSADIVMYDLVKRSISLLSSTPIIVDGENPPVLMQNEDGSLGLASIRDLRLYLWSSTMAHHDGKIEWVQGRVIELDKILPIDLTKHRKLDVSGFAEGAGILFISTYDGTFTFELKSGQVRKITRFMDFPTAFPFINFFTPLEATGRAATSSEPALKQF